MHGNPEAIAELRKEIHHLRSNCENLESDLKQKDCEVDVLKKRLDEQCQIYGSSNQKVDDKIKVHTRALRFSVVDQLMTFFFFFPSPNAGFTE